MPDPAASVFADHAAGSPIRPEVAAAMGELSGIAPNPSGAHRPARRAAALLDGARHRMGAALGAAPEGLLLASGGSESIALALLGSPAPTAVCSSAVEHVAVRRCAERAASLAGVEPVALRVDAQGRLDLDAALSSIPDGALVSVMAANNETGVVQPVVELVRALRADREVTVHCDAIAAAPTRSLAAIVEACDLVSLSGLKLGGPPIGLLVAKDPSRLAPLFPGGPQQRGLLPGTEDVVSAVGLAAALEAASADRASGAVEALAARRDRLAAQLLAAVDGLVLTGAGAERLAGHLHLRAPGRRSEELLLALDLRGVAASAGAACASGAPEASEVLLAMGVGEDEARSALRLSLSTSTTDEEAALLGLLVAEALAALSA